MMKRYILLLMIFVTAFCANAQTALKQPVIIELIISKGAAFKYADFTNIKGYGIQDINQWHNRVIVYAETTRAKALEARISKDFPKEKMVVFAHPFYNFNRKNCSDKAIAPKWDNIIMSANLVVDPKMQQEYLNYHATQFQKWPEVSQGFCNANFQQLLVFKTGRQLMLVISIPKGKSLDELNQLTTKNNPRVNDWNNMMKKYQEGIEGTKKGEVWVVFKDVDQSKLH